MNGLLPGDPARSAEADARPETLLPQDAPDAALPEPEPLVVETGAVETDTAHGLPLVAPELLVATCTGAGERLAANEAWTRVFGTDALWGGLSDEDFRFAASYLAEAAAGLLVTHQLFLVERPGRDVPAPVLLHFFPVRTPGTAGSGFGPGRFPVVVAGEVLLEPVRWAAEQTRRRRMEMLGQMAMGVAHDFNNLLTSILGHAELLRTTFDRTSLDKALGSAVAADARGQLRTLERAASDGAALVRKIQQYIRHEKRDRYEPVDLSALADEVLTLTRPYWHNEPRRQGIAIRMEPELGRVPDVLGSGTDLREVLVNLVLNAVQAMPAGGTIRLRTLFEPARGVVVEVEDTGMGMPESVRARIFEPLFTTKGERGSGMGLTVSHGIVQEHGGTIEVESEPGRGTLFRLSFAVAEGAREALPADAAALPHRAARLLVVDDEPMVRIVTARLLRLKGHTVEEAEGGAEALDALRGNGTAPPFDLLVTDLSMPGMTGRELAYHVRKRHPRLPIVLLTGDTDADTASEHVDAVVKKPFKLDDLDAVVQRALVAGR